MTTEQRITVHDDHLTVNVADLPREVQELIRRHLDAMNSMTADELLAWCDLPTREEQAAFLDGRAAQLAARPRSS